MSLKHTLLGFLRIHPMTGYDLKAEMDHSTQFFWHAGLSQIYPTLKKLEADGLISSTVHLQAARPDKKIYEITDAGRSELRSWLEEPITELPRVKDAILLKVFFSGSLEKEVILRHLRTQLDLHRIRIARYDRETVDHIEERTGNEEMKRDGVLWELVRKYGAEKEETYIRWLEDSIATVEREL